MNEAQHDPNVGENQSTYDSSGSRTASIGDSAGVADGLSQVDSMEVKNMGEVSQNQRAMGSSEDIGNGMKLGC
jgi:hypothetical protein